MALSAITWLNSLSDSAFSKSMRDCCASTEFGTAMLAARPFTSIEQLENEAQRAWHGLRDQDRLVAFAAHPRIGQRKEPQNSSDGRENRFARWSSGEQAGVDPTHQVALEKANDDYFKKFGFVFLVCATGKTSRGMLDLLQTRVSNTYETEFAIASEEQGKLTRIRLLKLLDESPPEQPANSAS
jgi:2-oxo-4-hydroxy-4-carboxy-5-ureidoimidazoline decarboxylase